MRRKLQVRFISDLSLVSCLLLVVFCCLCYADFEKTKWQYFKEILMKESVTTNKFAMFYLDAEVFDGSQASLDDLRIIDDTGREIPYILEKEKTIMTGEIRRIPAEIFRKNEALNQVLVDLGREPAVNSYMSLNIADNDFSCDVKLEGTNSTEEISKEGPWTNNIPVSNKIYDLTNVPWKIPIDYLRRTSFSYPNSNFQYLRITLDCNKTLKDITSVLIDFRYPSSKGKRDEYNIRAGSPQFKKSKKDKITTLVLDLGYRNLPIDTIAFKINSKIGFYRDIKIEGSNDEEKWSMIGYDNVFEYKEAKKTDISFPEAQYRFLKLSIDDGDNESLDIEEVHCSGFSRYLIFPVETDKKYYLYYSNYKANKPSYDLEKFSDEILKEKDKFKLVAISGRSVNGEYKPVIEKKPFFEEHKFVLWIVLFAIVGILLLLIHKSLRKGVESEGPGKVG